MPKKQVSVEVSGTLSDKETPVRRNAGSVEGLTTQPFEGIDTVTDVLHYCARTHATKKALGFRPVVKIVEEEKEVRKGEKKTWKYFELGGYEYFDYVTVRDRALRLSAGLLSLGLNKGDVFNIYAQTSVNWQLMQHACSAISVPIATAYDTLGESGLKHALNEPSCVGVFTNADLLQTLLNVLADVPSIKYVIYDGDAPSSIIDKLKSVRGENSPRIISLDELEKMESGSKEEMEKKVAERAPGKDDVICIMYTSGSTGPPKGVVLTHLNIISSVGAVINHGVGLLPSDTFLAFLPLSHILAYIVELTLYFLGITIGYGRVRTLTDASVRNCKGDIREFRPTIMIGVPAVWELIRKGIVGKLNQSGALKKAVFNATLSLKKSGIPGMAPLMDNTVLQVVKQQTGGRLRLALSGGAALSKETQEFLTLALVTVLQGYGMTESCGMCAILTPDTFAYGVAGVPVRSIEIKLSSVPDAGYIASHHPQSGEIFIRGPSVTKGYFKRDDLNKDPSIFTEDGWFRTGDVGRWNEDGTLSIIDRIKNLVKLSGGEYIALERLESIYKSCALVSNICVLGDSDHSKPIAIIFPHEGNLRHHLSTLGMDSKGSLHDVCEDKKVWDTVLKECNAAGKKAQFKGIELLGGVILTGDEWTPENGLVTAAQKIQRKAIEKEFKEQIKEAYKKSEGSG